MEWSALAVVLLLVATGESAALVVLALVIRDMQRELGRRRAAPPAPAPAARRPAGFRPPVTGG